MSMRCELTGKSFQTGNNVSHAKNRTKRRFKPNLQNITFVSEVLGQKFQLKVAVSNATDTSGSAVMLHLWSSLTANMLMAASGRAQDRRTRRGLLVYGAWLSGSKLPSGT